MSLVRAGLAVGLALGALGCSPPADRDALGRAVRRAGVADPRVLEALAAVPRDAFVPEHQRAFAWEDRSLPIELGQRITQPSLVGRMTELLAIERGDKVLEVGTGSGYHAAVLAQVGAEVYSIELLPGLADLARERLARLGYPQLHLRTGDGYLGWPEHAPFEGIVVTCAPTDVPAPLAAQLAEGGRLVIPVGPEDGPQALYLFVKEGGALLERHREQVKFVPLVRERQGPATSAPLGLDEQLFALLFSLAVEVPLALLLLARDRRGALRVAGAALVASGLSHPVAWWLLSTWGMGAAWVPMTAAVELAVAAFECGLYRALAGASWRRAAAASVLANAASFGLGQLVWLL